jgi:uncharacterized membrane protein
MKMEEVATPAHGIVRVTRHPLVVAASLWAASSLIRHNRAIDLLFWAPVPVFGLLGALHQDYRKKKTGVIDNEFFESTSILPFGAVVTGKQTMSDIMSELNFQALTFAISVMVLFRSAHFLREAVRRLRMKSRQQPRRPVIKEPEQENILDMPQASSLPPKPPGYPGKSP